jgi:hypothetical protein
MQEPIPIVLESLPGDTLLKRIDTREVITAVDRLSSASTKSEREILLRSGIPPICGERLARACKLLVTRNVLSFTALIRCFTTSTTVEMRKNQNQSSNEDAEANFLRLQLLVGGLHFPKQICSFVCNLQERCAQLLLDVVEMADDTGSLILIDSIGVLADQCPPSTWLALIHPRTWQHSNRESLMIPLCKLLLYSMSREKALASLARLGRGLEIMLALLTEQIVAGRAIQVPGSNGLVMADLLEATIRPLVVMTRSRTAKHVPIVSKGAYLSTDSPSVP